MTKDSISYIDALKSDNSHIVADSIRQGLLTIRGIEDDILAAQETGDSLNYISYSSKQTTNLRHEGIPIPFAIEQTDSVLGLLILCFLFFAHIYNGGLTFLKESVSMVISSDKIQRMTSPQATIKETLYDYFLIFQSIILLSVSIYDIMLDYSSIKIEHEKPLFTILAFIVVIFLFLFIKTMVYSFLGYVFDIGKIMMIWKRANTIAFEILGILYFIPTLLLIYSTLYHTTIIAFMLVIFAIIQITLFYQIINFFIKEKFNFLYLIAYLCTFEILPYIYLSIGLAFLYKVDIFNMLWP